MDFLSFLTEEKIDQKRSSFIILNSLALRSKLEEIFKKYNFRAVYTYLDHDISGRTGTEYIIGLLPPKKGFDKSGDYEGYKDYNAWRMAKGERGDS